MIREICQFVETIEEQVPDVLEEGAKLKEGIYIALDIGLEDGKYILKNVDENGNILKEDIGLFTKRDDPTPFFEKCKKVLQASNPVDKNKIFNPNLKIFNVTCSPYAVGCTKKGILNNIEKTRKDGTVVGKEGIINELSKQYLKKAEEYVEEGQYSIWFNAFKTWLIANFWELIDKIGFNDLKDGYVIVFFLKEVPIENYKKSYLKYIGENVFNKAEFNTTFQDIIYGVSDSLNTFNDKKRFLKHQSASFIFNYRVHGEDAQLIWKFYQLSRNKQLPNPLPIFVDKDEVNLNADVVKLFNNGRVTGYSEIIRSLLNLRQTNLQNFYLLFIQKGYIIDLDFVPVFKYTLKDKSEDDFVIKELFGTEINEYFNSKTHNVFDFQFSVVNPIFNKQLVQEPKLVHCGSNISTIWK
jgi:CRISPR-associated protein Csh1